MPIDNIYSNMPNELSEELFDTILHSDKFTLERIVSQAHATKEGEWLKQNKDEWVILLKGSAGILFEGNSEELTLNPGDHIHLKAHQKHRVQWTDQNTKTVWLALHFTAT